MNLIQKYEIAGIFIIPIDTNLFWESMAANANFVRAEI